MQSAQPASHPGVQAVHAHLHPSGSAAISSFINPISSAVVNAMLMRRGPQPYKAACLKHLTLINTFQKALLYLQNEVCDCLIHKDICLILGFVNFHIYFFPVFFSRTHYQFRTFRKLSANGSFESPSGNGRQDSREFQRPLLPGSSQSDPGSTL